MKNNIYKGYIASRNINGHPMPQRIQNMVIRTYVEKRGKIFNLSATEYIMDNCFMMLKALAKDAAQYEAVALFSMYLLPSKPEERFEIYYAFLSAGTEIHFAFEELAIKSKEDIQLIEDILMAKNLSQTIQESPWPYENL